MPLYRKSIVLSLAAGLLAASPALANNGNGNGYGKDKKKDRTPLSFDLSMMDDADAGTYQSTLTAEGNFANPFNFRRGVSEWRSLFKDASDRGDDFELAGATFEVYAGDELLASGDVNDRRSYRGLLASLFAGRDLEGRLDVDRIVWSFDFASLIDEDSPVEEIAKSAGGGLPIDGEIQNSVLVPLPGAGAMALVGLGAVASRRRR